MLDTKWGEPAKNALAKAASREMDAQRPYIAPHLPAHKAAWQAARDRLTADLQAVTARVMADLKPLTGASDKQIAYGNDARHDTIASAIMMVREMAADDMADDDMRAYWTLTEDQQVALIVAATGANARAFEAKAWLDADRPDNRHWLIRAIGSAIKTIKGEA